jgi:hypothetical protein
MDTNNFTLKNKFSHKDVKSDDTDKWKNTGLTFSDLPYSSLSCSD